MTAPITQQNLSDLIGRIYDCTLDPSLWQPTLAAVAEIAGARVSQLGLFDLPRSRTLVAAAIGANDSLLEVQRAHYGTMVKYLERFFDNGHSLDEPLIASRHVPEYLDPNAPDAYAYMWIVGARRGALILGRSISSDRRRDCHSSDSAATKV